MKKILPIVKPLITNSPINDSLLSVLQLNEESYENIIENFIDIYHWNINTLYEWPYVEFHCGKFWNDFDCLICSHIHRDLLNDCDIVEFLIKSINLGYYVLMEIDMYYNENYMAYDKASLRHEMFVYGYDDVDNTFYTADYFNSTHFITKLSSFEQVANSFIHNKHHNGLDGLIIFKNKDLVYKKFNIFKVYSSLKNLLSPKYFENDIKSRYYGFMYFEEVSNIIEHFEKHKNFPVYKHIHFTYNHIKMMWHRMQYLNQLNYVGSDVIDKCEELKELALIIERMAIKFNIKMKSMISYELLEKITQQYKMLISDYECIILVIIATLDNCDIEFDPLCYREHE